MSLSIGMISIDTTDPIALGQWWAAQAGGEVVATNDGFFVMVSLGEGAPMLGFQKVDDPTPGKNRIHLDLQTADRVADVARLEEAGATRVGDHEIEGFAWTTLADPDGNQFCVSARH